LARRPHPYFGRINRLEETGPTGSGPARGRAPRMSPQQEAGILWEAFRSSAPGASDPA